MSSTPSRQTTSGSDEDPKLAMDQKQRKRKISNRESARRSRMRKQQHLDDLTDQMAQLKSENSQILVQINQLTRQYLGLDGENTVLRTQVVELTERLRSLSSVLRFVEEFNGMVMDIPEIPDPLLRPWQPSWPLQTCFSSQFARMDDIGFLGGC